MAEQRSAQEVLDDHLVMSLNGNVEDDLARNYAQEVVVVSNWGVKRGHDGVREMARLLRSQLPGCTFASGATARVGTGSYGGPPLAFNPA